jgi:cob(I)alamin adenosyltransferase
MVRLDRIYTRSGDSGQTSLADGTRCSKLDLRIIAGGAVDELNAHIGIIVSQHPDTHCQSILLSVQQQLFDLGADLSARWQKDDPDDRIPRVHSTHVQWLESVIDDTTAELQPLTSFVLPGGTTTAAGLHVARTVCRRAERETLNAQQQHSINPQISIYLNRLSDLLFVLARSENDGGTADVLWKPGLQPPDPTSDCQ